MRWQAAGVWPSGQAKASESAAPAGRLAGLAQLGWLAGRQAEHRPQEFHRHSRGFVGVSQEFQGISRNFAGIPKPNQSYLSKPW